MASNDSDESDEDPLSSASEFEATDLEDDVLDDNTDRWARIADGGPVVSARRRQRVNRSRSPIAENATFVKSRHGKPQFVFGGYVYTRKNSVGSRTYWRCVKCGSTAITDASTIERAERVHPSHLPEPGNVEARQMRSV